MQVDVSSHAIAIVGATGLVGRTLLQLLEEKKYAFKQIHLLASAQSAGETISFNDKNITLENLETFDFSKVSIAFFCVSNELAAKYVPKAAQHAVVIDKSSFYRNHPDVPLVVPEVNLSALTDHKKMNIIANPNCTTVPLAVALKPLYDAVGIKRINITTYQSVSGTGKDAITELTEQSKQLLANKPIHPTVYPQQIAFNVLPHIDAFEENGYTREEMKMVWETQKIFNDPNIKVNATAVRVPVYCGHAAAVHIETNDKITAARAIQLLSTASGIKVMTGEFPYPTPVQDAAGNDWVYVGRIREDISHEKGLNLWVVTDNLRKGAALNALQIATHLIENHLSS